MKPSEPQFAKCVCQNCPGHIEFDVTQAGETVSCPHCGLETRLYVPPIPLTARGKPADQTTPRPEPTKEPEPRPEPAKTPQPEKPSSEQPHRFYFYKSQDGEKGPYTDAQLRSLWVNGHITADAVYRSDKSSDWEPLYDSPIVKPAQLAGRIPPLRAAQQWMFKAICLLSVVAFFLANVHISVPIVGKTDFSMFGFLVPHSRSPSTEQEIRKPNISDLVTSLFQSENGFEFNSVTTGWVVCGVAVLGLVLHYLLTLVWATVRFGFKRTFSLLNIVWLVLAIQFPILFSAGAHAVLTGATRQTANELEDNPFGVLGIAFVNNVSMTPGVVMWILLVLCLVALALPFVARKMSLPWEALAPEVISTPNPRFKILPVWGAMLKGFSRYLATDAARTIRFLDITGLALAIISCSLLWIPWINSLAIPLAAIGLLLALAGVLVRRKTQRTGHVLPICTGIVCAASVLAVLFVMPTHLFGRVLVVNDEGQDQRLSAVEISLVKKNTILAALEAKRQEIAARSAERRELEAAIAATARAQETYDQLRTNRVQSTTAESTSTQAELERALQEVETTTQAAQSWRTRNAQLQAAAASAVRRRTTRSSRDSSTLSYLEATANAIFQSGTMGVPRSGLGGPNVIRLTPPAGEMRELAEWRAFLRSAPEGLRIIADKAAENRRTVRELEAKLRWLGNNALADAGAQLESAKSRERAAKLQVDRLPSAEELLADLQPNTVKTTQTDASGAFMLSYQPNAAYAIFAKARNSEAEEYYWLVAAPSGRGTARLQLSGENVASLDAGGHVQVLETPNSDSGNSVVQGWSKSRTVKQGSISVTVAGASVGQVCYRDLAGRPQFTGPHLTMTLCVSNLSTTKKVDFETWRGSEFGLGNEAAILSDNLGNKYKRISVTPAPNLLDPAPDNASIHPHKVLYDHVVFEVPLQNATTLRLELPAKNFGGKGTLRLEIPAKLVK